MNFLPRIWLITAVMLSGGAQAQSDEPPVRYAVEVIIFEHLDQSRATPEVAVPPLLPQAEARVTGQAYSPPGFDRRPPLSFLLLDPRSGPPDFLALPAGKKTLDRTYRRLADLDAYRPVVHLAWTQRAWPREAAEPLDLGTSGLAPAGLSGSLTLYKERYLHLAVDLQMNQASAATINSGSSREVARIVESRRLRGDIAQYFDNPRFGAIARVWELEPPGTAAPATADSTG